MRSYKRLDLSARAKSYLERKTREIKAVSGVDGRKRLAKEKWEQARRTKAIGEAVVGTLRRMAGRRERCMYCEDSRGTDVDHFWPKSAYPDKTFLWPNMLFSCSGCQRDKGARFPLSRDGAPLLIDPTVDEPWEHLYFVSEVGRLTPRFDPGSGEESERGAKTLEVLPLNIEPVSEGRLRVTRRLIGAVEAFLQAHDSLDEDDVPPKAREQLQTKLLDEDGFGVLEWFFVRDGKDECPFRRLRRAFPEVFRTVAQAQR